MEAILALFISFADKYQFLASVIVVIGTARLFMKPVVTAIEEIVKLTKTTKDDEAVEKAKQSKVYKTFVFIADYILSVKPIQK